VELTDAAHEDAHVSRSGTVVKGSVGQRIPFLVGNLRGMERHEEFVRDHHSLPHVDVWGWPVTPVEADGELIS
jgi:hypothetical protein